MGAKPRVGDLRAFSRARGTVRTGTLRAGIAPAAPVEEDPVDGRLAGRERGDHDRDQCAIIASRSMPSRRRIASNNASSNRSPHPASMSESADAIGDQRQASGKLGQVPLDRFGLPAEGVEAGMVEIGRGEGGSHSGVKRHGP